MSKHDRHRHRVPNSLEQEFTCKARHHLVVSQAGWHRLPQIIQGLVLIGASLLRFHVMPVDEQVPANGFVILGTSEEMAQAAGFKNLKQAKKAFDKERRKQAEEADTELPDRVSKMLAEKFGVDPNKIRMERVEGDDVEGILIGSLEGGDLPDFLSRAISEIAEEMGLEDDEEDEDPFEVVDEDEDDEGEPGMEATA